MLQSGPNIIKKTETETETETEIEIETRTKRYQYQYLCPPSPRYPSQGTVMVMGMGHVRDEMDGPNGSSNRICQVQSKWYAGSSSLSRFSCDMVADMITENLEMVLGGFLANLNYTYTIFLRK